MVNFWRLHCLLLLATLWLPAQCASPHRDSMLPGRGRRLQASDPPLTAEQLAVVEKKLAKARAALEAQVPKTRKKTPAGKKPTKTLPHSKAAEEARLAKLVAKHSRPEPPPVSDHWQPLLGSSHGCTLRDGPNYLT